ncbi:hypothetical protein SAMN05421743_10970 [Thalassobacillus cyri]|uniref:Uncharacterized protein n=1 Tax=Thalassobacillus cyri TaxID=571932 RepID=A0A1H4EHY0_9BACI|nr:hypothetical protein [Thalassobacillus cyri]SEA84429.1 hypothetical protein SAMN05421743_10970 [Thalassobacillus cyri]
MKSETYLDFCFIREMTGTLAADVQNNFERLFKGQRLHWYLDDKTVLDAEVVVAEVKGMSSWASEQDVIDHLEAQAGETFWQALQGYQFHVYPPEKGCGTCGVR